MADWNLEWNEFYPKELSIEKIAQFRSGIIELQMCENSIYLVLV